MDGGIDVTVQWTGDKRDSKGCLHQELCVLVTSNSQVRCQLTGPACELQQSLEKLVEAFHFENLKDLTRSAIYPRKTQNICQNFLDFTVIFRFLH